MTYTSGRILALVQDFIDSLEYDRRPASLYAPVRYALSSGGKRMRPVLMLMAYNLFRDDPESVLMTAAGIETYHNYTLLHDDLMDRSDMRRGRPTVHRKWNENTAILSGDSMLVLAYGRVASCPDDKLRDVLDCFTRTALEVGEGQQYDMDFENRTDVGEDEYMEMIRLKTSVLLACSMKIGGILAGASPADLDLLYSAGQSAGLAFQLQDDYLDVYGDEAVFGKPIGGDICNNKKTYMLINAMRLAAGSEKEKLSELVTAGRFDPEEKIAAVTAIYSSLGIDRLAKEKIGYYFREADAYLSGISVERDRKRELRAYVASLKDRKL